jgi:DNA-binding protein H-NS
MTITRELRAQLGQVNERLAEARAKETAAALAAFKELVQLYGLTEQEVMSGLGFGKGKRPRLPVKYYDPHTGKKWTGQGSTPKWLQGKNPDDYLVRPDSRTWWPGES